MLVVPSSFPPQHEPDPGAEPAEAGEAAEIEVRRLLTGAAELGLRLDKALVALAPEFSRSHLQGLIERGHVRLDGQVQTTASRKLRPGQQLELELVPTAESLAFRPEAMVLDIVHEDAHLLVLNKPAGLVVHPAAGNWSGTLLNGLLAHHAGAFGLPRAGIVHRLDKDTSGLMVVAKTLPAMTALVRAIAAREVRRIYLALAHGAPRWSELSIDAPIGRDPQSRLRMAVVASGKPARTDVECLARAQPDGLDGQAVAALRCKLHSGRTHQIRVHLASRGHPLLADALYGGKPALGLTRQALHATELAFAHPHDGRAMAFQAPLPADLAAAWALVMASTAG
ncbi:MAG: RluA family pseudouridine synthase [Burkholderiaceae bacterium]|nr:RluA family pseudouridine synthase [Burkholderiaceae bacterium]